MNEQTKSIIYTAEAAAFDLSKQVVKHFDLFEKALGKSSEKTETFARCIHEFMEMRKKVINRELKKHEKELLPDIVDFNEALTNAMKPMGEQSSQFKPSIPATRDYDFEARIWFGEECPIEDNSNNLEYSHQSLWNALIDLDCHREYQFGIHRPLTNMVLDSKETFEEFIGHSEATPNWNEGLDKELTKDLHLIMPFHSLFEHTQFALSDFLYVRKFRITIESSIEYNYPY